jgi:hypothetical protein
MVAMTDVLSRPILRVPQATARPDRPAWLLAAVGAAAVALGGLVLCLAAGAAGWFAADTGTFGQAMRVGTLAWLVGNGSGLSGGGVTLGAIPLGFVLVAGLALYRTGRWAASTSRVTSRYDVGLAILALSVGYAAPGTLAAVVVDVNGAQPALWRTVAAFVLESVVFGGAGVLKGADVVRPLLERLPEEARAALLGGATGVLAMVAVGAVLLTGSLVAHFGTALRLAEGMHAGLVGGVIFALIGAALVPNAVLCAAAFATGSGFAVGTGTQVSPSGVRVGLLPDFPLLAALPSSADAWWVTGLIVLPVVAGALAGLVAVRRYPAFGLDRAALRGACAGVLGGLAFGLLTGLATGSFGPGRLHQVGPDVVGTTAVSVVAFALGGTFAAVASRLLGGLLRRRTASPDPVDDEVTQPIRLPGTSTR